MGLMRSSFAFASGTLLSRVVGLLRESVVAGVFGATVYLDAFLVANRIPNLLRELVAEGALGASFTKVYTEQSGRDPEHGARLLRQCLFLFALIVGAISLLGIYFSPQLVDLLTHFASNAPEKQVLRTQSISLTRILFPFIWCISMTAILAGALHQQGRFFFTSMSPMMLNVGYLMGALLFTRWCESIPEAWFPFPGLHRGIFGLAIGVLLGGFLQLWLHVSAMGTHLRRPLGTPHTKLFPLSPELKKIFVLMAPMLLAASSGQINVLINTNFATRLEEGAVSWLTFSFRILQLPIGIFAVAVASVCLPRMSRAYKKGDGEASKQNLVKELKDSLELILWLILPCFCFTACNSHAIVSLLFQHGNFSAYAVEQTATALYIYNFSVIGYSLVKVLTPFYYVHEKTTFPMWVGFASIGLNFFFNSRLAPTYGHVGIAATLSIVLSLNALILFLGTWKHGMRLTARDFVSPLWFLLTGGLCLWAQTTLLQHVTPWTQSWQLPLKVESFLFLSLNFCLTYGLFLLAAGLRFRMTPTQLWTQFRPRPSI